MIDLKKVYVKELEKDFYISTHIQKISGHTNIKQAVQRILSKSEYLMCSRIINKETFDYLIKHKLISNKTQKIILISEEGLMKIIFSSKSKKAKDFINVIIGNIINARKDFNVSEVDFINVISGCYDNLKEQKSTYVMYDKSNNLYKIGIANDVIFREKTLSGSIPQIKTILVLDKNIEKYLHNKFLNKRIRGEWFELNSDDILSLVMDYNFKKITNE